MATIEDLMRVTHRSRRTVIREVEAGNMPGYRVTGEEGHVSYHIPDEAFAIYCQGYWVPRSQRTVVPTPYVHRRVDHLPTTTE